MIALDTHTWVWFHVGDSRLPEDIAVQIGRDTLVSAASIWEVMVLLDKGRLRSRIGAEDTVREWLLAAPMKVVPIDEDLAILSRTLRFEHDDPADRFIAATAHRAGVRLATQDARLRGLSWLATI